MHQKMSILAKSCMIYTIRQLHTILLSAPETQEPTKSNLKCLRNNKL